MDGCTTDDQCGPAHLCACEPSGYTHGFNLCVASNCRVDSDCGQAAGGSSVGGACSPTACFRGVEGYYCHTKNDECNNDNECPPGNFGQPFCDYQPEVGHWTCNSLQCAPG